MISTVPAASQAPIQRAERPAPQELPRAENAIGQQAKRAVAVAEDAGASLPKNAQGLAASAIARGIDPSSLFQALVTPPVEDASPVGDPAPLPGDVIAMPSDISPETPTTETPAGVTVPVETGEVAPTEPGEVEADATTRLTAALETLRNAAADTQDGLIDQIL